MLCMERVVNLRLRLQDLLVLRRLSMNFVPSHSPIPDEETDKLQEFMDNSSRLMILTGAGISTESGIPDYRSEEVGMYARTNSRPVQHQEFMKFKAVRQRYWARNFVGHQQFSSFQPNKTHLILAQWERQGSKISSLVTQNVDYLHQKAGSEKVVELHGTAFEVKCMNCNSRIPRSQFQRTLIQLNPSMLVTANEVRPDGDVELAQEIIDKFVVPPCEHCQDENKGILKPDIVFFGDNVPRPRVELVYSQLESSDSLLVLGSSLHVYSGYRFILKANELGKAIAIVNIGPTRGDKFAQLKLNGKCSDILSKICI